MSSKDDPLAWLARTCHRLLGSQALGFSVQAGHCPTGRSRKEQVQTEEDGPSRLEPGGLDGGTAFVRHLYKGGIKLTKYLESTALDYY